MNLDAWLALLEQRHPQAIELGLGRCGAVYRRMGSPRPATRVFTVAGTNGKGSTVAYLAAMSGGLGQRYGSFTSPHIFRFNERISVMGEPVSDDCLIRAFEQVEAARDEVSLTYFEFTTLAALLILNQSKLDCAVLEVGLGGRLDTVNLVDADCVVITPIGLDHQEYLGPDLFSIASEKAGVMRLATPVVCTQIDPPRPILETAAKLQSPVYRRGVDFALVQHQDGETGLLQFSLGDQSMAVSMPPMGGKHQVDNLAAALAALILMNPDCLVKANEISAAIQTCQVPGRLQKVLSSPEILLDVGHNELAAEALAVYLEDSQRLNTTCILAMLADKSAETVALAMDHVCKRWLCADSSGPRGQSGEQLARRISAVLPAAKVSVFGPLDDAMQEAFSSAGKNETILVFGSFATVSAVANWLQNSLQHDRHDADRISGDESGNGP
ncbi:MAG: folylpolyglutamate synthase/dihydrofolate synthase family protein [Xanthomonadales bacterium]|nr:folylpolyglutamate synthase/dihydrofolate synthase family protein [Xanthomonadales bacterium]